MLRLSRVAWVKWRVRGNGGKQSQRPCFDCSCHILCDASKGRFRRQFSLRSRIDTDGMICTKRSGGWRANVCCRQKVAEQASKAAKVIMLERGQAGFAEASQSPFDRSHQKQLGRKRGRWLSEMAVFTGMYTREVGSLSQIMVLAEAVALTIGGFSSTWFIR